MPAVDNVAAGLLYRGEVRYTIIENRLVAGAGRFVAPAAVLLPVDGLRAQISLLDGNLLLAIFGAEGDEERRSQGLRAVSERLLREFGPA